MISIDSAFDWIETGFCFGIGFVIPFGIVLPWMAWKIMSHPTLSKLARAADKLASGASGSIIEKGVNWLFGGGK